MVGAAASRLKARIELNYQTRIDDLGRTFSGVHDTVLPLANAVRTIFQQLRKRSGISKRKKPEDEGADEAPKINGSPLGRITGVDMRHLLLLLPFLLFELLSDEVSDHNEQNGTAPVRPAILLHWFWCFWNGTACTGPPKSVLECKFRAWCDLIGLNMY